MSSSESNYEISYGGYSSKNSYSSESRDDYVSPLNVSRNLSESREPIAKNSEKNVSSESRETSYEEWLSTDPWIVRGGLSSPSEMHEAYEEWVKEQNGIKNVTSTTPQKKYNSLDDIDKLIERLEAPIDRIQVTSEKANEILEQRKQKIDELRKLVEEARKNEAEENMIRQLEQENNELDVAIDSINKGFHK